MIGISFNELKKTQHLNIQEEDLTERVIPLFPVFDSGWKQYANTGNELININITDLINGLYFSKQPLKETDLKFEFFNMMFKKNNLIENKNYIVHIMDDIENLSASVEKIIFFSEFYKKEDMHRLCKYASVELEAIFQNSRAIFENLQNLQNNLIKNTISANNDDLFTENKVEFGVSKKKATLQEYMNTYKIPESLAQFYVDFQEFFFFILEMRNDIFHSRKTFSLYLGEEGFSISLDEYNLNKLNIWHENNTLPNNLGSVKTLLAYIVFNTIKALEDYSLRISAVIKLPNDISPEYDLFYRSDFNKTLMELQTYFDKNSWRNLENTDSPNTEEGKA